MRPTRSMASPSIFPSFMTRSSTWIATISPITKLPLGGSVPNSRILCSLHSKFTGDAATCGGRTTSDARIFSPASSNSLTPYSYSPLVTFMASANSNVTMLTTNSPVSRIFTNVPFGSCPFSSWRMAGANPSIGGLAETQLKNENGARLGTPSLLSVETHAIGRGPTAHKSIRYSSRCGTSSGRTFMPSSVSPEAAIPPASQPNSRPWPRSVRSKLITRCPRKKSW